MISNDFNVYYKVETLIHFMIYYTMLRYMDRRKNIGKKLCNSSQPDKTDKKRA
jgi:hypothetical protein